jgi:hypothetical protein
MDNGQWTSLKAAKWFKFFSSTAKIIDNIPRFPDQARAMATSLLIDQNGVALFTFPALSIVHC